MRATTKFLFLGALAMCLSACLPTPPDGDAAIFRRPPRYGAGSTGGPAKPPPPKPANRPSGNRFGHTDGGQGSDTAGPDPEPDGPAPDSDPSGGDTPGPDGGGSDKPDMADGSGTSSGPPSNLNSYPYARLVPGKKGFVTLPGADASVGEIDVTGIKPGTPVEINDPRDTSKKIYFRVP